MGRLRAEGAWNRWFHQRPRSNDQGAASNCEICTEASGTEQFLQAGVYFFFNYGIAICADSRLSGFAKNLGFSTSLKNIVEKNIVEIENIVVFAKNIVGLKNIVVFEKNIAELKNIAVF